MVRRLISTISFIILIGAVLIARFNPVLFDFNYIHNIYALNFLYRAQSIGPWLLGLLALVVLMSFGPVFCGYICPFGSLQRLLNFIGRQLGIKKVKLKKSHLYLSVVKYFVLVAFIYLLTRSSVLTYINIDPYHAFIRLFWGGVTLIGGSYLIVIILLSLFIERPFCNYLCPYGAGLNLLSWQRLFKIERTDACINCKMCDINCPAHIQITAGDIVKDVDCLSCHKCREVCPKEGALKFHFNKKGVLVLVPVVIAITTLTYPTNAEIPDIPVIEEPITVEPEVKEEEPEVRLPLKETSTEEVYYGNMLDFIPTSLAKEKNAQAIFAHQEKLKKIEAERLAKEEADRLARQEAERQAAEQKAKEEAERKAKEEAEKNSRVEEGDIYRNGTYRAKVNAFAPDMVVQVKIENDKIISVQVISHNESRSYFDFAAPKMIKKIIDNNSTNVTVVSGATYTSLGIRNAVNACLSEAER